MAQEPLYISRGTWSAVQQFVSGGTNAGSAAGGGGRGGATSSMIVVRNRTGETLKPGAVVGLGGLVNTPETNPDDWYSFLTHKAVKPDPAKFPFALAMEEIEDEKTGYALIGGISRVDVDMKNPDHQFARPVKDDVEKLESCAFGPARLLYREGEEEGVCIGLVHFPLGESWDWGMVLVKTSERMEAYTVLAVDGAAHTPSGQSRENNAEFLSRVAVRGGTPSKTDKDFVITLADAPGGRSPAGSADALVPALYAGICPCLVNIEKRSTPTRGPRGRAP